MEYAEQFAIPIEGELGGCFERLNDFEERFVLRWGRLRFNVFWGLEVNLKVVLRVYRGRVCETYTVDTDPSGQPEWNAHHRHTRDFFLLPLSPTLGRVTCVKFAYVAHFSERSVPSEYEYIFMDGPEFLDPSGPRVRPITRAWATRSSYHTQEIDLLQLQRDVDWANRHFDALRLMPKFTKGLLYHPYHPKRFIHDHIDKVIALKRAQPSQPATIKVSVDCIDDADFIQHLLHAHAQGVVVQCVVDWRKMTLTNSPNYAQLKQAGVELVGVICTPQHPLIEVAPDMHTKFIIFGEADCILGSFNITFDRWWANWESGMTFHSQGVCRLLDNIFQSQRGGVIQKYVVDPLSHFNLLYTYGRHALPNGKPYLPHHAILSELQRAQSSIKLCLFLIGELVGEHGDSVIDALIGAHQRGVAVHIILNGHLAWQGEIGLERTMAEELQRDLIPAVRRLREAGVRVALAYGQTDHAVPYSPLHAKYAIIDEQRVLEGSFNWYNTSVFSHDLLVVVSSRAVAEPYLYEFAEILRTFRLF